MTAQLSFLDKKPVAYAAGHGVEYPQLPDFDLSWFAGLYEGEGTCGVRNNASCQLTIQMTDLDVLVAVHDQIGGILEAKTTLPGLKDAFRWRLGDAQRVWCVAMLLAPMVYGRRRDQLHPLVHFCGAVLNRRYATDAFLPSWNWSGEWPSQCLPSEIGIVKSYNKNLIGWLPEYAGKTVVLPSGLRVDPGVHKQRGRSQG